MDTQARYLIFHGAVVLVAGLLVGFPLGRAVHRDAPAGVIKAWRLAHDTLTAGPVLAFAVALVIASLGVNAWLKSWIAWSWIASNYGFCFSLPLAAMTGQRGHKPVGPLANRLVFAGNLIGIASSSLGAVLLLYAAYLSLP